MNLAEEIRQSIFNIPDNETFNDLALKIFRYQYETNKIYREFSDFLHKNPQNIANYLQVPFLPISLFRDQKIISGDVENYAKIFTSSGTTGSVPSQHYIKDLKLYEESFLNSFELFYGRPERFRFLALLPGYLERQGSSLVYMLDYLIRKTEKNGSGFFLHDMDSLKEKLSEKPSDRVKTILFGASYALLDFADKHSLNPGRMIVMETGGMKGRHKEMIREELHDILCRKFNVDVIHSEYGMTELLSQAYSNGKGIYRTPSWMKILVRDVNDPLLLLPNGQTGGINIIDLANIHSCSFLATQDLGVLHKDGSFEVVGRFDDSDARGCNLMVV